MGSGADVPKALRLSLGQLASEATGTVGDEGSRLTATVNDVQINAVNDAR